MENIYFYLIFLFAIFAIFMNNTRENFLDYYGYRKCLDLEETKRRRHIPFL